MVGVIDAGVVGAGAKTRLESRIQNPDCVIMSFRIPFN